MNAQILVHCVCQFQLTSISVSDTAPLLLAMPTILSGWVKVYDYNNHDLTWTNPLDVVVLRSLC